MQVYRHVLPGMQADAAATSGEIVFGNADWQVCVSLWCTAPRADILRTRATIPLS
jgi:hypothetical protein